MNIYDRTKKRNIKKALKAHAKAGGDLLANVRADIEATIDEAMNSNDPQKCRQILKDLLEINALHREEYIYKITKKTKV